MQQLNDRIAAAVQKCPFLHQLAVQHGEGFARSVAADPNRPAGNACPRPLLEEMHNFETTLRIFHGPSGVVPLSRFSQPEAEPKQTVDTKPVPSSVQPVISSLAIASADASPPSAFRPPLPAPMGSISLSLRMPGPGEFPGRKPSRSRKPDSSRSRFKTSATGPSASGGVVASGTCPLRAWLGPLAPLVFNKFDKLACPEPIMKMRAAVAQTQAVKDLRAQAVPVKIAALAAMAALLNIPFGAVREHTEKFSLSWILVVHATIPVIAMMRKAVVMPKYAIIFTIAAAIAGQALGARLERKRLAQADMPPSPTIKPTLPEVPAPSSTKCPAVQLAASVASKVPAPASSSCHAAVNFYRAPLMMNLATMQPPGIAH